MRTAWVTVRAGGRRSGEGFSGQAEAGCWNKKALAPEGGAQRSAAGVGFAQLDFG